MRAARLAYRSALFCALLPLATGISIFLLWLLTRQAWLMAAGVGTLIGGVILTGIGSIALVVHIWRAYRASELRTQHFWLNSIICIGLLIANYPVAGGILWAVALIESTYTVTVHNKSGQQFEEIQLFGGCSKTFGRLDDGKTSRYACVIHHDGPLSVALISQGVRTEFLVDGYVSADLGGKHSITITPNGPIATP